MNPQEKKNKNIENASEKKTKNTKKAKKTEIKTELIESELAAEKDKFVRLFAEFENYKKRNAKERIELFKTAGQEVIHAMLPVLDDFERALNQLSKSKQDTDEIKGVKLIQDKLKDILKSKGLEEINIKKGTAFDADKHEAVSQIPASSDDMKGKIIDVIEKGYLLGEKIIRHPKVVVAN